MRFALRCCALWASLAAVHGASLADEPEPVSTDRPTVTPSPDTVDRQHATVEQGMALYRRAVDADVPERWSVPYGARVGLWDNLELRIQGEGPVMSSRALRVDTLGVGDPQLGVKARLMRATGWRPTLTVLGHVVLPLGTAGVTAGSVGASTQGIMAWALPGGFTFFAQGGVFTANAARAWHTTSLLGAAGLSAGLSELKEGLGMFLETTVSVTPGSVLDVDSRWRPRVTTAAPAAWASVQGGLVYVIHPRLQVDVIVQPTLDPTGLVLQAGTGVGIKL